MKLKILHIEDNMLNLGLVRRILRVMDYTIIEAQDGKSGLNAALTQNPDLILLDIHLPDMDGTQIAAELKSIPALAHIPIVALTADSSVENQHRCQEAGCDAFILKPYNRATLLKTVVQFTSQSQRQPNGRTTTTWHTAGI
ncbi:MAG: response regulator [Anaerolineaceae bacterium]|nr:MAG: response regulator [Anaerolineaceae bacterium]